MSAPPSNGESAANPSANKGPVQALLRLTETAGFFRSTDGRFCARVSVGGRPEIYPLRSPAFRDWLIDGYFRTFGEVPSDWSVRRALAALEAIARFEGGTPSIFLRVGHGGDGDGDGSAVYLDLADPSGQAVKIGPEGWSVIANPGVNFRRPYGHLPLPTPSREGSIELLRPYVNLTESDFRLLIVWMAAALRPVGPYPVLALYGEHGTAKSTLARVIRLLIDPHARPLVAQPRNPDNRREASLTQIEDSLVGICLLENEADLIDWFGTAADLLSLLTSRVRKRVAASPRWPKSPLSLSREVRRIAPQLRVHGLSIVFGRNRDSRIITITCTTPPTREASHVSAGETESCFETVYGAEKEARP
jgi:hypothetical protein